MNQSIRSIEAVFENTKYGNRNAVKHKGNKITITKRSVCLRLIKTSQPSHSYSQLAASPPLR